MSLLRDYLGYSETSQKAGDNVAKSGSCTALRTPSMPAFLSFFDDEYDFVAAAAAVIDGGVAVAAAEPFGFADGGDREKLAELFENEGAAGPTRRTKRKLAA